MMFRRRRGWGGRHQRSAANAVKVDLHWPLKKARKCDTCGAKMAAGDIVTRLALGAKYRKEPCSCGRTKRKTKYFHAGCMPADTNKAMGYDPTVGQPQYEAPPPGKVGTPPPPPPPQLSAEEAALAALVHLEGALVAKVKLAKNVHPDMEKAFERYQKLKSRAVRPGTPAEGEVAMGLAITQIVKLIWNS